MKCANRSQVHATPHRQTSGRHHLDLCKDTAPTLLSRVRSVMLQVGSTFSPVDALRLAAKAFTQRDIRRAADQMIAWLDA